MKKIIVAIVFIACQSIALWLLLGVDFNSTTEEVDMEIYEFEHEGHGFLIFEEDGRTVSVIHDPNCDSCVNNQN
jgi:hypothetical protein